jgi:UDP-glucose 4-epimerase
MDMVEGLKVIYPGLETIFVDQHIPLHDLTMECDRRLAPLLPNDTSIVEDLQKFKELFTF